MPVGRLKWVTAIVMAYAVMLILVSPAVPSPLTTLRSKHTIQPPQFVTPVAALLFTAVIDLAHRSWLIAEPAGLAGSGSDIVDLTTARLC
ncbi:MAG TPA: hypothetical protein VFI82_08185 [Terriglobales bacterium]|jgi:hypothetical protein|nr:hypothetical protein [Terriglobales bacterium]